ncbi:MAG: hypothetical protein ACTSQP_10780 [Promethearchaeota archaeon]
MTHIYIRNEMNIENIKYWNKRIKYNTIFKYCYFLIYLSYWYLILILDLYTIYIESGLFLSDLIFIITVIAMLKMSKNAPKTFHDLINFNKNLFKSDKIYQEYKNSVYEIFNSKIEFYIPLFISIIYAGLGFYYIDTFNFIEFKNDEFSLLLSYMILIALRCIIWAVSLIIIVSGCFILHFILKSLMTLLNNENYFLNVRYRELRMKRDGFFKFVTIITYPFAFASLIYLFSFMFYIMNHNYLYGFLMITLWGFILGVIGKDGKCWLF